MIRTVLIAAVSLSLLGACTWVKLEPTGNAVRVAREGEDLSYCDRRGEISVSVKHNVAFIERNPIKVRDELETMARNEAPSMRADTVQAIDEPLYGEQRFAALACRDKTAAPSQLPAPAAAPAPSDAAETYPVRED
jgi:hypothetical protein